MTTLAPVSVALKFGFLAVLYLFLLWVARSALRDLRGASSAGVQAGGRTRPERMRPACTRPPPRASPTSPAALRGWWWSARRDTIPG